MQISSSHYIDPDIWKTLLIAEPGINGFTCWRKLKGKPQVQWWLIYYE